MTRDEGRSEENRGHAIEALYKHAVLTGTVAGHDLVLVMFNSTTEGLRACDRAMRLFETTYEHEIGPTQRVNAGCHVGFWMPTMLEFADGSRVKTKEYEYLEARRARGLRHIDNAADPQTLNQQYRAMAEDMRNETPSLN